MTILAAVESSDSRSVARIGADLAETYGEPLILLNVLSQEEFDRRREQRAEEYTLEDGMTDAASVARETADAIQDREVEVETRGQVGEPTKEILDEADRMDARYLVIGSRKRSPVGKAVFGSTTQSVLLNVDRPVVAVPSDLPAAEVDHS